jgi:hypothetical protein
MWPYELRDEAGGRAYDGSPAFRCVMCGELVDSVILTNRNRSATGHILSKGRTRFHSRGMRVAVSKPS